MLPLTFRPIRDPAALWSLRNGLQLELCSIRGTLCRDASSLNAGQHAHAD